MTLKAVILDVYNTLFRNDTSCWVDTFRGICSSQGLPIAPEDLYSQWKTIEVRFRQTRTNMENPDLSPPFSTYQSAWRQAFVDTFALLDMKGNADEAAQMSVDGLAAREPFEDTFRFLEYVRAHWKVGVLTNADNGSVIPLFERYNLSFDALVTSQMAGAYKPTQGYSCVFLKRREYRQKKPFTLATPCLTTYTAPILWECRPRGSIMVALRETHSFFPRTTRSRDWMNWLTN